MSYIKPNLKPNQFAVYAINRMSNTTYSPRVYYENGVKKIDYTQAVESQQYINSYIPITFYDGEVSTDFSIYDEQLSKKGNSQYTFNFSIAKYLNEELNPYFYLIVENRKLRVQTFDDKIDFIITSITPTVTNNNIIYQVSCQDVFSYNMSKQNISISYDSSVPKNIADAAVDILNIGKMDNIWKVDETLETGYYADFPSMQQAGLKQKLTTIRMKVTMNLQNSTIFNALVELSNKFNADLRVIYSDNDQPGIITFKNKLNSEYKGYQLRPETNLTSFSVSRNTNNFCSVMHIKGGEGIDGNIVEAVPPIPLDVQKYLLTLYPHSVENSEEEEELKKSCSYNYLVTHYKGNEKSKLYRRIGQSSIFAYLGMIIPWTKLTSAEIQENFRKFDDGYFIKSGNNSSYDVDNYFNFLCYRCKCGASMFYNFDYFRENGLMDEATYQDIEKEFSIKLRNANLLLYCINHQYNTLSKQLLDYETQENSLIAQLCALDEQEFEYDLDPEKVPKSVLNVNDDNSLSRTTVYNMIDNDRVNILNNLKERVWTDEYYKLLLTLYGVNGLTNKMYENAKNLEKQKQKFKAYQKEANKLLAINASTGQVILKKATVSATYKASIKPIINGVESSEMDCGFIKADDESNYIIVIGNQEISYTGQAILGKIPKKTSDKVSNSVVYTTYEDNTNSIKDFKMNLTVDNICYRFHVRPAVTVEQKEEFLSLTDQTAYVEYCTNKKHYLSCLAYIEEVPSTIDPSRPDIIKNPMGHSTKKPIRRGLYAMKDYYYKKILQDKSLGYLDVIENYTTPFNLEEWVQGARVSLGSIWKEIYTKYGDFIVENNYSDTAQLSSEGLFMVALQEFSKYNQPSYEYSATTINSSAISNITSNGIDVGDLVYIHNKDISSQYSGEIIITIPKERIGYFCVVEGVIGEGAEASVKQYIRYIPNGENVLRDDERIVRRLEISNNLLEFVDASCLLYNRQGSLEYVYAITTDINTKELIYYTKDLGTIDKKSATDSRDKYKINKIEVKNNLVYIHALCDLQDANELMLFKDSIDTIEFYTCLKKIKTDEKEYYEPSDISLISNVLNIEMGEKVRPIPLQVTGVTHKLREATSQITVSTDNTMSIIFSRLVKQARF